MRVTPVDERKTSRLVQSGVKDQDALTELEGAALKSLRDYDKGEGDIEDVLEVVKQYESQLYPKRDMTDLYRRTLCDRPWNLCSCRVCKEAGIEVVIYRGANRNKRRGFHNLFTFYRRLKQVRAEGQMIRVPCIRTEQSPGKFIYSFVVDGKQIPKFAGVSRVGRGADGILHGYQRPEVLDHIDEIRSYLDSDGAILPNSIVIAFQDGITFEPLDSTPQSTSMGNLLIDISKDVKPGWIVDGQQRVAALRSVKKSKLPVSVVGFNSENPGQEREQFVLVNSSKPLPKSLVYELLPSMENYVPPRLKKRQEAYRLLERLNLEEGSPFYSRIRTTTSKHLFSANIKDLSVLKMLENSLKDGVLFRFQTTPSKAFRVVKNFWIAVRGRYGVAWDLPPKMSRLTHGVGIVSMGYVMDMITYRLLGDQLEIPRIENYAKELSRLDAEIPWTEGVWKFSTDTRMPWNGLQNTNAHIDLLTNHLIRKYRTAVSKG